MTTKPNESSKNQMSNRCNFLKQIHGHEKEVKSKKVSLSVRIRVNIKNLPRSFCPILREPMRNFWFALVAVFVKSKRQIKKHFYKKIDKNHINLYLS